jgi:hypothetical protein
MHPGTDRSRHFCAPAVAGMLVAALGLAPAAVLAQPRPAFPPPPATYDAAVRYRIDAARDQHVAQFDALVAHLEKLGFEFTPPLDELPPTIRENPYRDLLKGLIPAGNARKILDSPAVASVLLRPPAFKLPEKADQPVAVQMELVSGFLPTKQLALVDQVRVLLQHFGFEESTGYDNRGYTGQPHTRLRGTIPVGQLDILLSDLRRQPTGWLAAGIDPADLPVPLRGAAPILMTEVLPDASPPSEPLGPPERGDDALEKIGPGLWALLNKKGGEAQAVRLEIVLATTPAPGDEGWRQALQRAAPSLVYEGRLGQFVTAVAGVGEARALAALPTVSVVRLPRPPLTPLTPAAAKGDDARALRESGLEALHQGGARGQGARVAVVDSDFRGLAALVQSKRLPATTALVDLTAHRNPHILPDPEPQDGLTVGHGTHCALAVALAAPRAEITLIRIDAGAPYMLKEVSDLIRQGRPLSPSLVRRSDELIAERANLRLRRAEVMRERRLILENFEDEKEAQERYGFLGPVRAWVFSPHEWHYLRLAELERDEAAFRMRYERFRELLARVRGLQGIQVVVSTLVWNERQPLGGRSPLVRLFDTVLPSDESGAAPPASAAATQKTGQPHAPLWLTPAGNTRGQVWTGMFRDADANGVMEFTGAEVPLPADLWTRELAFLAWQPLAGARQLDLPAKTKLRVAVQWTEVHDPDYFLRRGEPDLYLQPLARLRLTVLRQRDSQAKLLPADDFEVVARSWDRPQRLDNYPGSATYELAVEFTADSAGRYALQLEKQGKAQWILVPARRGDQYLLRQVTGLAPTGIRPPGTATLPALELHDQLEPRFFIQAVGGGKTGLGRPVFRDFATDVGTVGTPADARRLITVGAAGLDRRAEAYSAPGPPPHVELFVTPRILAFGSLDLGVGGKGPAFGTDLAASFAAGATACLLSAGWSADEIRAQLLRGQRQLLRVEPRR